MDPLIGSIIPSAIMLADPAHHMTSVSGGGAGVGGLLSGFHDPLDHNERQESPMETISFQPEVDDDDDDDNNTISTDLFSVESQDSHVFDLMFEIPNTISIPGETSKCPAA